MLVNVFRWLLGHIGGSLEQKLEKAVEATIEAGKFAAELAALEVGQTATAPQVQTDELGKSFKVDIRVTRTA